MWPHASGAPDHSHGQACFPYGGTAAATNTTAAGATNATSATKATAATEKISWNGTILDKVQQSWRNVTAGFRRTSR